MELGEPDASGRRRPIEIPNSDYELTADTVIAAIGQKTLAPKGFATDRFGNITAKENSYQISDKLYSVGDCLSGAATVVEAVAGAFSLAEELVANLKGETFTPKREINVSRGHWQGMTKDDVVYLKDVSMEPREKLEFIPIEERKTTFKEVTHTMTPEQLSREGKRCIECSCTAKSECKLKEHSETCGACPDAIKGEKLPVIYNKTHPVIIQDLGKCIKCGTCVKICAEVINKNLLSAKKRGFFTYVGTAFDKGFPNSCADCMECIHACPVGALDVRIKE